MPDPIYCGEPLSYWVRDMTTDHRGPIRQEIDVAREYAAAARSRLIAAEPEAEKPRPQDYETVGDLLTDLVAAYSRWGQDPTHDGRMWATVLHMQRLAALL